jgi:hypothetical protein
MRDARGALRFLRHATVHLPVVHEVGLSSPMARSALFFRCGGR